MFLSRPQLHHGPPSLREPGECSKKRFLPLNDFNQFHLGMNNFWVGKVQGKVLSEGHVRSVAAQIYRGTLLLNNV